MVVKTKKNIKKNTKLKTKFMKGGVVTDEELHEGFINLFKEFDLEYDSINQPFIDLEQPEQSQEYVANLMNMLWDVGKADFFNKEDAQRYFTTFFNAFHENIMNTIRKNRTAPDGPHITKNFIITFFRGFMEHLNNYKNVYNLILVNKYDMRTSFYKLFNNLIYAYGANKQNTNFQRSAFAKKYLLKMTLDTLGEVLNVARYTDFVEEITINQIPQSILFLDYLMSLNNKEITDSIKNYINSLDVQKYYVEGGVNWETFQPEDLRLIEELYENKEFRANNPKVIEKGDVTYTKEFEERKLQDARAIVVRHFIFELNGDPNNPNYKQLLQIMGKGASKDEEKQKEKEKEPVKEKEKPKEVQRHEPRIHQPQQLPQQVARPVAQARQSRGTIQEIGTAHLAPPVSTRQPPAPPSTPATASHPPVLRGRPPAPSKLTTEEATSRAQRRVERIMGHLEPRVVSAAVNKQKEDLEQSINELINKDPINAGFLINDAIEFIKQPVPQNVNISQWVNEFDKTANEWAMEFSATRTSPQRKSRLVTTFKNTFKDLIKIMPNTNELFVMLVNDMARSAQVARTNIPQVQQDSQFSQFQQNLQRYQAELTQQPTMLNQPAMQSQRGRPQLRPATSQQRGRPQLERPLMGGNKKKPKKVLNK